MRPLTPTLLAAQKAPSHEEVVVCRVLDAPVEWPRWTWSTIYTSADPDGPHAIAQLRSGALVRARQDAPGAVYVQKITDPTQPVQWSTWTTLKPTGSTKAAAGIALASSDAEDRCRLFYVDNADGRTIRCAESTDGATWAESLVTTEPSPRQVTGLAADMAGGDAHLIYSLDLTGGAPSEVLVAIQKVGGVWTNRVQHAELRYPTRGLCAAADPATGYIFVGVADGEADGSRRIAFQELDGNANTWAGGTVLVRAPAGSGFDFLAPSLRLAGAFPRHTYTWVEQYVGSIIYNRPTLAVTPQRYVLTEWVPWDVESSYGLQLLRTSNRWYLSGANRAYASPLEHGVAGQLVDVSADLVAFDAVEPGPGRPSRLDLLLDNASGGYGSAGQPGAHQALREGSQLALGLGFRTASGPEWVWTVPWWIDRVAFEDERGTGYLRLECVDAWAYLERLRAPRQLDFPPSSTVGSVLNRLLWRVTGASLAATGALATLVPGFTIGPGESYAHAVRRLCDLAGVLVRFGTDQAAPDGLGLSSVVPAAPAFAGGPSSYSYASAVAAESGGQHPIARARHAAGGQPFSHVELFGAAGLVGEALDHAAIRRVWKNIPQKLVDRAADTQAKADAAAAAALAAAQAAAAAGFLESSPNVAVELGDVVDVTDPRAGLSGAKRTVVAIRTTYDRRKPQPFTQRLTLAGAS